MKFDISLLCSVAVGAQVVLGTPIRSRTPYNVKETHTAPSKWTKLGRAPSQHKLHLKIGLKQNNFEELSRHLNEVSNPDHGRYGQHLSVDEVNDFVKPTDETLDLTHEWLLSNGVSEMSYSPAKDWINILLDVGSAEALLDTEYSVYRHEDGTALVRTSKWSLPSHLHEHIDTIQPTTSFMRSVPKKSDWIQFSQPWTPPDYKPPTNETISKVCQFFPVTIECFQTLYATKGYQQKAPGIAKIAFNNFLNQTPIRPDIEAFLKHYRPEAADSANTFKSIEIDNGPAAQSEPLTLEQAAGDDFVREANLDAQTILGMTYPQPVYSYSTGGSPPFIPDLNAPTNTNEPYLEWVNFVMAQHDIPQVISTSYGDDEQTVPEAYARRVCQQFARLGARGVSLLVSSGDDGVGDEDGSSCYTNDGKNKTTFLPSFPASCPYVTSVGATQQFEPEVSAYRAPGLGPDGLKHGFYASGSGFSYYFDRPDWQDDVVPAYVKSLKGKYDGLYNKGGRGYPDISAQGLYFAFVFNLTESSISGTSASCPLMSSVVSLVNDALISSGKPTMGWLNPWLYKKGYKAFTDVTIGDSYGCGTKGFPVAKGWDPVTGFGTPIFPEMVRLAKGDHDGHH
ncbi:Subtilisin-like protein [Venustampulla echinocandica]|uniref:tripeptidyl-peptidase II n=1 Tax=Venustampulla echinocandica TaxID=2656787 RepID=A0A370TGB7_9HELO|nr:Subtilisin-like protein [Venustampulla echinocandica]RDL33939.1 Subtilisin-like protein [Venustampulla echinocandica]